MLGFTFLRFDTVSSTNDVARELAVAGEAEGVCVIAREQTAGRGRQGRSWSSPPGEGLYLSLILRPPVSAVRATTITLAAAVAVAETLRLEFHTNADIKWPNDVLVNGRKICGILVEAAIEGKRIQYAVMGIGVNIAQPAFPQQIDNIATSLFLETGRTVQPEEFAEAMLPRIQHWYETGISQATRLIARWEELSSTAHGCPVSVESAEGRVEGTTRGLTATGALIVETSTGERREIVSGEVRVRGAAITERLKRSAQPEKE
jgi:BirA family transcriptional regulator, biotin operon repressor / biotin---[acetyl-CoA-carboxylase] ligase